MTLYDVLSAVKLAPGQTLKDFALAHAKAGRAASKHLNKTDQHCAAGNCGTSNGKKFKTKEEAAKAALEAINKKSIADNKEFAGQIYKNSDGTYGYTDPVMGTGDESRPSASPVPDDTQTVGNYHTHGDYSVMTPDGLTRASSIPGLTNPASADSEADNFSQGDIKQYQQLMSKYPGFTGYLGTPSGNIRSYDTTTNQNTIVGPLQ